MPTPIKVRSLDTNQYNASKYISISFYILGSNSIALIIRKIYIIDNLSANVLLKIDVIKLEGIILDLQYNLITISAYNALEVPISTRTKSV